METTIERIEREANKAFPTTGESTFTGLMQTGYKRGAKEWRNTTLDEVIEMFIWYG